MITAGPSPRDIAALIQWRSSFRLGILLVLFGIGLPAIRWSARRFEQRRIREGRWGDKGANQQVARQGGPNEGKPIANRPMRGG